MFSGHTGITRNPPAAVASRLSPAPVAENVPSPHAMLGDVSGPWGNDFHGERSSRRP